MKNAWLVWFVGALVLLGVMVIFYLPVYEDSGDLTWGTYCRHDPYTDTEECLLYGQNVNTLADEWWPSCTDRFISGKETVVESFMIDGSPAAPRPSFEGGWYILQEGSCEISHPEG